MNANKLPTVAGEASGGILKSVYMLNVDKYKGIFILRYESDGMIIETLVSKEISNSRRIFHFNESGRSAERIYVFDQDVITAGRSCWLLSSDDNYDFGLDGLRDDTRYVKLFKSSIITDILLPEGA